MLILKSTSAQIFLLLFTGAILLAACHKSSDDNTVPGGNNPPAAGLWKISYFFDKKDETSRYNNFTFDFKTDGGLIATDGTQTWMGSWSTNCDDSANKMCLFFGAGVPSALTDLAEDWLIIEKKNDFMHFEHTSGGNGDTDVVHFSKL